MAQPQPQQFQPPPAQQAFSPPPPPATPITPGNFSLPAAKRQRLESPGTGTQSQTPTPYVQSPYTAMSPNNTAPNSGLTSPHIASPHFGHIQIPQNVYNTPYAPNGGATTPTLSLPNTPAPHTGLSQPQSPYTPQSHIPPPQQHPAPHLHQQPQQQQQQQNHQNYFQNQTTQPIPPPPNNFNMPPRAGDMPPPSKPEKQDANDALDVLAGTGIDIREEENYNANLFSQQHQSQATSFGNSFGSGTVASGQSFTQFPPGSEGSFYGAGPANQPGQPTDKKTQEELEKKAADHAWHSAAVNLAKSRQHEMNNPFIMPGFLHYKMARIAHDNGLALNVDKVGRMGDFGLPKDFREGTGGEIEVRTATGPDGTIVQTNGAFLPADSPLVDQIALLSLATNQRLRTLLEDAVKLAKGRQTTTQVPTEWADVAVENSGEANGNLVETPRTGLDSAISPHSIPQKRPHSSTSRLPTPMSDGTKTPATKLTLTSELSKALRASAETERDFEEARLLKRQNRSNPDGTPRSASVAPGTPGSVAPELGEKAPTKKELKKKESAKQTEAQNHKAANQTTAAFLGGGGGMFGKKGKKYSWMTGGGSGASTPGKINTQIIAQGGGQVAQQAPEKQRLTSEGVRRLGELREDRVRGEKVQMRDWVAVLADDGKEVKALQKAYNKLEVNI